MELTRRERVRRALTYQAVDRLPTQFNYTASMGQAMAAHFGVDVADLPDALDNHLVRLDMTYPQRFSEDGKARFDWWGAGHDTEEEGYYIRVAPLARRQGPRRLRLARPARSRPARRCAGASGPRSATAPSSCPTSAGPSSSGPGRCAASRTRCWSWRSTPATSAS